ncbi:peptidoglycan recognition protein [Streptomyces sp. NPDC091281]|uniref:peptidoglycan recognition protein family protein n=1 Tax=Streptomyces sp. NPDC091281 TaxID=3365985 RepID=UPI0038163718
MRGFLAPSIGVTCAAALALPLTPPATAATAGPTQAAVAAALPGAALPAAELPGGTESLPLTPLTRDRAAAGAVQGLPRRDVRPFSLLGVVWDDPEAALDGTVQVRTRAVGSGAWSAWQDVETHNADHGADPGTAERASGRVRGATAPLWVGASDGVEIRVSPATAARTEDTARGARTVSAPVALPAGLRLELVDPGAPDPAAARGLPAASAGRPAAPAPVAPAPAAPAAPGAPEVKPYIGPRPAIVTRKGWGADEKLREKKFVYTKKVKAAFVHHSATGNSYTCAQAPSVIRGIYRYHVKSMGWRDLGYNFVVDKCGKIYEGRAGGVAKPVLGAHTLGFNTDSMGIAVLGTFTSKKPSAAAVTAIAKLTAWKLGLSGANPKGKTYLKSGGGNLYRKGKNVRLDVISGHRDGFATECPGKQLYGKLGTARSIAARYQGR